MPAVANYGEILGWVERRIASRAPCARAADWVRRRLPPLIAGRPGCLEPAAGDLSDDWSGVPPEAAGALRSRSEAHVACAVANGEPLHRFRANARLHNETMLVLDWLCSLPESDPARLSRIGRVSWDQAAAARRWHEGLARRAAADRPEDPDGVEEFLALEDGWRWVRLTSEAALDREGALMGHCVGSGGYDRFETAVLSLRDPRNRPHATVEWDEATATVVQVQGRGNGAVVPRHRPAVLALVERLEPERIENPGQFGHVMLDGELVALADFAAMSDLSVWSDVSLSECEELGSLPDGLEVAGFLDLSGCPNLRRLPSGLKVRDTLNLHACPAIETLPDDLEAENLILTECAGLRRLPSRFALDGFLDLEGCAALPALPERLEVGGSLDLSDCTGLKALPERLPGDIAVSGGPRRGEAEPSGGTVFMPDGTQVRGVEAARAWFAARAAGG